MTASTPFSDWLGSDPEIAGLLGDELNRQRTTLQLIASENFASTAVLAATGSVLTNKYAEGYPGRRYYGGNLVIDEVEELARQRLTTLFGAEHANVQPHSGANANLGVYQGLLEPGDTILAMRLDQGGHLTHGSPASITSKVWRFVSYGLTPASDDPSAPGEIIDLDQVRDLALEHRPKLIVAGATAYSRTIDAKDYRSIADEVGAYLMFDCAHTAGLIAGGAHPSPVGVADVVTFTTHKTLRGPRGGAILCSSELAKKIDSAIFPGLQGGPLEHVIAAKAVALGSDGDLVCLETGTGKIRWQKNLRTDFGGKPGTWAYAESPLVDDDNVICTPGGREATLVALNKKTGALSWKCALPESDEAAYASAIIVEVDGLRQCVQLLQKGLVGVDAKTGKFLWRYGRAISRYGANIPSPLSSDGYIYTAVAGTGGGVVKLKVTNGNAEAEQVYFEAKSPAAIGGVIKMGDCLYGTTADAMLCLEFTSGKVKWQERALGAASLCCADGRLYLHGENGEVALVEPAPDAYREKGRFTPPGQTKKSNPMEKAWAYPVVADGRLYVRDHGILWCYDVKAGR